MMARNPFRFNAIRTLIAAAAMGLKIIPGSPVSTPEDRRGRTRNYGTAPKRDPKKAKHRRQIAKASRKRNRAA